MGTDISLFAEVKWDETWRFAGEMERNADELGEDGYPKFEPAELHCARDYDLFGILGGVNRARRTVNWQEYEMIAPRRGLPVDVCSEIRELRQYWGEDAYCDSWLLLSEVLAFDWQGKRMQFEATVDARVAHLFRDDQPFPLDQWPDHIAVEFGPYLRDSAKVRWTDSYADSVDQSFFQILDKLKSLGPPDQTRLVFWFGS